MLLSAGTRLGPYEIRSPLGAGGMGEVYRARDTTLNRDVAIKVLPHALAANPERVARLAREAQTLASLNDPNIGAIFGFEDSHGIQALVLELVEGPTLADRIAQGPIPVDEAIAIARQIARALDAAHAQGIVHRDLKPANVKVRDDGTVKVLDFGLAKVLEPGDAAADDSASPTLTSPAVLTAIGVVLGTSAYMAPEQARGQAVDKRSDVWAFGCVLYEMLTGRRAFAGQGVTDTLAAVLRADPDWRALPDNVPPATRALLERCLRKDRTQRIQDISTARFVLAEQDSFAGPVSGALPATSLRSDARWIVAAVVVSLVAGGAAVAWLRPRIEPTPPLVARFALPGLTEAPFAADGPGTNVAISPDGSRLVYTAARGGVSQLVVRALDRLTATAVAGTEGAAEPFFSPDGTQVAFVVAGELKRVPVDGGRSTTIWRGDPTFTGGSWGPDNVIVFSEDAALYRVAVQGGDAVRIAQPDVSRGEVAYNRPSILPGGRTLLYTVNTSNRQSRIVARPLGGGDPTTLIEGAFGAQYLPSGYLVYGRDDRLMAVHFDPDTLQVSGAAATIEEGVFTKAAESVLNLATAADGTAVYVVGRNDLTMRRVVWFDRQGVRGASLVDAPLEYPRNLRLSPDGQRMAVTVGPPGQGNIWAYELGAPGQSIKLTFQNHNTFGVWSPDGKRILFLSIAGAGLAIASTASDGSTAQPDTIIPSGSGGAPMDVSSDGASLLVYWRGALSLARLGDHSIREWFRTPFPIFGGRLSPDGRWLAYTASPTGVPEVWIRPFPDLGPTVRVSSGGGHDPVWARDGQEIFYTNGPKLMAARVASMKPARFEAPHLLFEGGFAYDADDLELRYYDVTPDGRFLMIEQTTAKGTSVVVAQHWDQEVKARVK